LDPAIFARHQAIVPLEAMQGAHATMVGCGSLGTLISRVLVRFGIPRFHLIDPGAVGLAHLNRAVFTQEQVGQNKASALMTQLLRIHRKVRCVTTAKPFSPDHLTRGEESVVVVTTSDPKLPHRVLGAVADWPAAERPIVVVARHSGLTGGYWLADLARGDPADWSAATPWLSLSAPPRAAEEPRLPTMAHFTGAVVSQAIAECLVARLGVAPHRVRRRVDLDLAGIVRKAVDGSAE
jgi:hypothetical protein